jgi:pyruvate dehydrogenase E1 component alpha subunit
MMALTDEQMVWMYETMLVIREFEEQMVAIYMEDKLPPKIQTGLAFDIGAGPVPGEMHLASGQEPVAVGACVHLRADDAVVGTHRPHHFAIAKGVPLNAMAAEIFGKATGLSAGKGGHMHLFAPEQKFSCSGIEGASLPPACGAALAAKMQGRDSVAVAFLGEGAANQGTFHESLNLAALWKLPAVFIVEDNGLAISVKKTASTSVRSNASRAAAYGIPGYDVLVNDPLPVAEVMSEAVDRARGGGGPTLIEVKTDRLLGHFQGDGEVYRTKEEVSALRALDPIPAFETRLRQRSLTTETDSERRRAEAKGRVQDAYAFARESPYPEPETALQHVFV